MIAYLERYGGFKSCRETGLVVWILAHAQHEGIHCPSGCVIGTERIGWGVERGLCSVAHGGAPPAVVYGADGPSFCVREAICANCSPHLGSGGVELSQRVGGAFHPQNRDEVSFRPVTESCCTKQRWEPESELKAQAQVFQEAQCACGEPLAGHASDHVESSTEFMAGGRKSSPSKADKFHDGAAPGGGKPSNHAVSVGFRNSNKAAGVSSADMISYPKWCANLVPMVLRSRTPFSAFLHRSVRLLRDLTRQGFSTPAFFPVPVFEKSQFFREPSSSSSSRRRNHHLSRAVEVVCMALNFWYFGGRWMSDVELRREPNSEHKKIYARIASLIRSDGLAESFPLTRPGRKS